MPLEPLLTPADVAAILRVSLNTARRIMRETGGTIYVGKQMRWTRTKLERYLRLGGSKSAASENPTVHDEPNAAELFPPIEPCKRKRAELFPPIRPRTKRDSNG